MTPLEKQNIHHKLLAIQTELKAPKNQFNKFGNYNYRSAEDILESLKPLLKKHQVALTISDDLKQYDNRFYVAATVKLQDCDSVNSITTTAFAREEETKKGMDGSQITGSASSYARKYALNGMFAIDDTKDADGLNKHGKEETIKADKKELAIMKGLLTEEELKLLLGHYAVQSVDELDAEAVQKVIAKKSK